ncbi:hypothetical protein [Achromobacter aloeverae]|uniref:Uncharacterized protein n=1 Tax=Achromobacter aloeverae TaxID=1750518 RepID=A0A4Q1HJV4_9BURK|nr:hypothetical protein [Achromobacter aloeverae]RXN88003.1 hypothetical protein C7R54_15620 [Achromobacter aloeverae]
MNDQLQKALANLLGRATQGVDAGVSFLQAQLPDVIQQLLVWKLVASLLVFGVCSSLIVGCVGILLKMRRIHLAWRNLEYEIQKYENVCDYPIPRANMNMCQDELRKLNDRQMLRDAAMAKVTELREARGNYNDLPDYWYIPAISMMPSIAALALYGFTWIQIWIAPKLYLIEYAASLGK